VTDEPRHRIPAGDARRRRRRLLALDGGHRCRRRHRRPRVAAMTSGRRRRALVFGVIVVFAIVAGNLLAYAHNAQADLSATHRFSLAPETRGVLDQVKAPLEVTAFLNSTGGAARDARFLLARYHELNRHISFSVVDPDADPTAARRFGISQYSTVVLTYRGRRVEAPRSEERRV